MSARTPEDLLPESMLRGFRARAPRYDAQNVFFDEDLAELRGRGYLAAPVPVSLGGAGLSLEQLLAAQRRLAAHAPATALGVNMHLVWVQVARFLHDRGDDRLDWVLRDAVRGEVFAFGISEAGNEAVLMDAGSSAERLGEGAGYRVSGTKIFTTLSPVWTRLGVHARWDPPRPSAGAEGAAGVGSGGGDPHLVFGFVRRDGGVLAEGAISHPGTWNPLGMRATQSLTTALDGVRIAEDDVAARIAPYDGSDPLILAIFSSFSLLTAAVYAGIADRALELATEAANRSAPTPDGREGIRLDDPDVAARLSDAVLDHRASLDALAVLARDVDAVRERADWFLALAAARNRVTDEARRTVDTAMRLVGAAAYDADGELARLYRDVLAGLFHPSSSRALARTVRGSLAADPG
ncbi:acyl-CoA/acyl-ACP dehydrogenase [Leucobacter weissii]|uniref:Acyl-CoA/acyl-ACP dehydrogenase n=1 Tax=Leucobacter weissii TaxID=1983706 RepID=A0A939ML88_9MICO|nr:acyl-CoA dehydrogenase family protein [Leucobacter weissii]MBO1900697.1 acyl-CoA/acyl-ACP dehydrogenase [Leucobacter weissii]